MREARFLETPITHASDRIVFFEATGFFADEFRPLISRAVRLTVASAPKDFQLIAKRAEFICLRQRPADLRKAVEGRASAADMQAPGETPYRLEAIASDTTRLFNPRRVVLEAGNRQQHWLPLYRSPMGTTVPPAGALVGNVVYESGDPASWAIVSADVTPTVGDLQTYRAQADKHGDFIMPLNRMPALGSGAPSDTYALTLTVAADGNSGTEVSAPDDVVDYLVADIDAGNFATSTSFSVEPGKTHHIASDGENALVIRA